MKLEYERIKSARPEISGIRSSSVIKFLLLEPLEPMKLVYNMCMRSEKVESPGKVIRPRRAFSIFERTNTQLRRKALKLSTPPTRNPARLDLSLVQLSLGRRCSCGGCWFCSI